MNKLREEDIDKIVNIFTSYQYLEKFSRNVELDDIEENYYNLSVTRYVEIFDEPEPVDIEKVWNELKQLERERAETKKKLARYLKELGYEQ